MELRVFLNNEDHDVDYFKRGEGYDSWDVDSDGNILVYSNANVNGYTRCIAYYPHSSIFKVMVVNV